MSSLHLTNGAIYTFINKGNPNIALHLNDNKRNVTGRPVLLGSKNQQWQAIASDKYPDAQNFIFNNLYSNGSLSYTYTDVTVFCSNAGWDINLWSLTRLANDSDGVRLNTVLVGDNTSAFLQSCDTPDNCPILIGHDSNDSYHRWTIKQVV